MNLRATRMKRITRAALTVAAVLAAFRFVTPDQLSSVVAAIGAVAAIWESGDIAGLVQTTPTEEPK